MTFKSNQINKLQIQLNEFKKEFGKKSGIIFISLIGILITGQYLDPSVIFEFYLFGTITINALILIFIIQWVLKRYKKSEDEHDEKLKNMLHRFEAVEQNMVGRIRILEKFNPYAVWEIDRHTGFLTSVNDQFKVVTGWKMDELNAIISNTPEDMRPLVLSHIFAKKDDWSKLEEIIRSKLEGNDMPDSYEMYFKRKNGEPYPVEIQISMVGNNGYTTIHGMIQDLTHKKDMEETIDFQNIQINQMIEVFTDKMTELELGNYILDDFIPRIRAGILEHQKKELEKNE